SGAALFHLDRIEAGIASDVEHRLAGEVGRHGVGEALPLDVRVVAEEVIGRGLHAGEVDVVKPAAEGTDLAFDVDVSHEASVPHRGAAAACARESALCRSFDSTSNESCYAF